MHAPTEIGDFVRVTIGVKHYGGEVLEVIDSELVRINASGREVTGPMTYHFGVKHRPHASLFNALQGDQPVKTKKMKEQARARSADNKSKTQRLWMRVFMHGIRNGHTVATAAKNADEALDSFNRRFGEPVVQEAAE